MTEKRRKLTKMAAVSCMFCCAAMFLAIPRFPDYALIIYALSMVLVLVAVILIVVSGGLTRGHW
jgi:hypothetical protein